MRPGKKAVAWALKAYVLACLGIALAVALARGL